MPFDFSTRLDGGTLGVSDYDRPSPEFLDTVGAAFRQENIIGSYISSARRDVEDFYKVDPTYNPFDDLKGYEDYADRFENAYNPQATSAIKADIDREIKDRNTLQASGWTGIGLQMGATLLDPTILIPGGALVKAGRIGYRTGRSAVSVGMAAAVGTAAQEAGLQATQEIRPGSETALAIGGSAILGGLVGAAGAKFFSKAEWDTFSRTLRDDLSADMPNPDELVETIVTRAQSAGASAVDNLNLDDLGVGGPRIAQAVAKATAAAKINPGIQSMLSPSVKMRETYTKLVDNPIYSRMNMEGNTLGPDVENLVKQYQRGALSQWIRGSRDLYREAKVGGFQGSKSEFYEAVAMAGRRGDVDPNGNRFVTLAAQDARAKVFDPLLKRAQELKLLPEDVKVETAQSYVTRFWNRQSLLGREDEFRSVARDYFRQELAKLPANKKQEFVNDADLNDYIEEVVTSVFNNLTGRGAGDVPDWLVPVKRGPLKERTFKIPDAKVEQFLENDMELILRRYSRIMGAEVELTQKFGRADMKDQIDAIKKEYQELRAGAKTEAARVKLDKAEKRDVQNIEAFRDMIRGTYRAAEEASEWSRLTRGALAWNYMRLLGGVTMSSLMDAARPIGVHGVRNTMREAMPALLSNLEAARISRQDARDLGVVSETVLQTRLASLADLNDPYAYGSKFERYLSNATNLFSKATGLAWWNDTMKTIAAVMTQNRILRNVEDIVTKAENVTGALNESGGKAVPHKALKSAYESLPAEERAYMAYLGISPDDALAIKRQFEKHGIKENGIRGANISKWDDEIARRVYAAALAKDVDRTIITKGVADTPLWMKTNWGKLIMQFKSFGLASHQRVLIAGLQERPHRLAEQMVLGTAIGMMVAWLKFMERGDTDEAQRLVNNPGLWVSDGLDRTGILSLPFEISNTAEKLGAPFGLTTAAQTLAGDEDMGGTVSRYATRNKLGAVMGPSAGLFEDLATIAEQLSKGDLKKSGANAIIRQIPGATLPGVRSGIHMGVKPALVDAIE